MERCLIAVQGPLQFVTALIALLWLEKKGVHKSSSTETVLLMYDFSAPDLVEKSMAQTIEKLAVVKNWDSKVFIDKSEMKNYITE